MENTNMNENVQPIDRAALGVDMMLEGEESFAALEEFQNIPMFWPGKEGFDEANPVLRGKVVMGYHKTYIKKKTLTAKKDDQGYYFERIILQSPNGQKFAIKLTGALIPKAKCLEPGDTVKITYTGLSDAAYADGTEPQQAYHTFQVEGRTAQGNPISMNERWNRLAN